ncbi:MAG TPA: hypothetical protein VF877_02505 [Gaiellaceae bacterium]
MIAELTDWLLFLHILAAIVWLGGLVMPARDACPLQLESGSGVVARSATDASYSAVT